MKYGLQEISEMDDWDLLEAYSNCGQALAKREEAGKHEKFNKNIGTKSKMEFPPINPKFIEMQNEIENEIKKRKLKYE